jgi:hypothetical protein
MKGQLTYRLITIAMGIVVALLVVFILWSKPVAAEKKKNADVKQLSSESHLIKVVAIDKVGDYLRGALLMLK